MQFTHFRTLCVLAAISFLSIPAARAAYTVTVDQVGPNVVATGSGSINAGGLTIFSPLTTLNGTLNASDATIGVGPTGVGAANSTLWHTFFGGPSSFGPGTTASADTGSGAPVGVVGSQGFLVLPENYINGSDLGTSTDTWSNQTISSLGLTPGTYVFHLPDDTFTLNILPEPASLSLLALTGLALRRRRHTRKP